MKKISFVLVLCIFLSFGMNIVASAEENSILPRYNNTIRCDKTFYIENNTAYAVVDCLGITGVTTRTTIKIFIEKRVLLGLWWNEVDSWEVSTTDINRIFVFTTAAKSGTYRCNFEITFEGNGGSADVITDQITVTN